MDSNRNYDHVNQESNGTMYTPRIRGGTINWRKKSKILLIVLFLLLILVVFIVFVIFPVIFKYSKYLQSLCMFTNINLPRDPKSFETTYEGVRNIRTVYYDDVDKRNISLGVWHILPALLWNQSVDFDDALANSNYSVIIHFHGSGETRKDSINMFSVLFKFFHVIAFDYRDFGDSTAIQPTDEGVRRDSIEVCKWLRKKTQKDIYIWGHSLGTSFGTFAANQMMQTVKISGLILEAPFTNMQEVLPLHPYGKIFAWMPWFKYTILDPLKKNGFLFDTDKYIVDVNCPVMILHAEDDSIIPFKLGKKLANIAMNNHTNNTVIYHQFPGDRGYDHFRIYLAPEIPELMESFIDICDKYPNTTSY